MALTFIEPTVLYNYLSHHSEYPNTSNTNYLLLLDCRTREEYNESHVVLGKFVKLDEQSNDFKLPYDAELECKENVVVYDGNTSDLDEDSNAVRCAKLMANNGSKNPVQIVTGGYERFSALYPFLRTQKIIFMPQELDSRQPYPYEVVPGKLYLGSLAQASLPHVMKDLKIKAHVKCTNEENPMIEKLGHELLLLPTKNLVDCQVKDYFAMAAAFIGQQINDGIVKPTLVYCDDGVSCSPVYILAFLMSQFDLSLKEAWTDLRRCHSYFFLNSGFVQQLCDFEEELMGKRMTDPDSLQA
ncbi:hypothetical protein BOX15_Mlig012725g1 [Macrostomum lignano]|uniref:Rhodanese domain-containing protein n=1 Tax=Macrostomum lignano TaxID=282301 RepID=A0A267DQJ4_9PLAT|nr:hypothetical protein BOX15_Mlig009273g1 [Macrostomum lignano]PAA55838.1 hypothetical protein BOX15_Mlig012725g1 [Macrostomum lignano]